MDELWLKNLKPGDQVGINGFINGVEYVYDISEVADLEGDLVRVKYGTNYKIFSRKSGRGISKHDGGENSERIVYPDQEVIDKYNFFRAKTRLRNGIDALLNVEERILEQGTKTVNFVANIIQGAVKEFDE